MILKSVRLIFLLISIVLVCIHCKDTDFITPKKGKFIPDVCKTNCSSNYNTIIGISYKVKAFSNCNNDCENFVEEAYISKLAFNTNDDIYTGVKWQCVEYSRRWLIVNKQVTYGSIESAFEIFEMPKVHSIYDSKIEYHFLSFQNDNTNVHPNLGDLLIYKKDADSPHGHVCIVVNIDLEHGYVDVVEQNYYNSQWENESEYSRRITLVKKENGNYLLLNKSFIINEKIDFNEDDNSIIGWKRIGDRV